MTADPEHQKLDDLDARIRAAGDTHEDLVPQDVMQPVKASQSGYEFVGTVIICTGIGYLLDRYIGTKPWGIIGMLILGFVAGIVNVWRTLMVKTLPVGAPKNVKLENDHNGRKPS
jgi:ATP synthase protein I